MLSEDDIGHCNVQSEVRPNDGRVSYLLRWRMRADEKSCDSRERERKRMRGREVEGVSEGTGRRRSPQGKIAPQGPEGRVEPSAIVFVVLDRSNAARALPDAGAIVI